MRQSSTVKINCWPSFKQKPDTADHPENVILTEKHGGCSIVLWKCFFNQQGLGNWSGLRGNLDLEIFYRNEMELKVHQRFNKTC